MLAAHVVVHGMVQGVGFRITAQQKAVQLGLNGWIKNLSNGDVELVAEGEENKINQFLDFLQNGPSKFAKVENMEINKSNDINGYKKFEITG